MAEAVYVLCLLTSLACAVLLLRGWRATANRLLLWSGLCFAWLALNNGLLVVDRLLLPTVDLSIVRALTGLLGVGTLLYGLIWEST